MMVFDFYSYKDNNNNALTHDKMWASLLEDSFKFGISSLVRLHVLYKIHIPHSLCILIRSDVICMIMCGLWAFYFLSYIHLTWSKFLKFSDSSLYFQFPACQLSIKVTLRNIGSINEYMNVCSVTGSHQLPKVFGLKHLSHWVRTCSSFSKYNGKSKLSLKSYLISSCYTAT